MTSLAPGPPGFKKGTTKEKHFGNPGLRGVHTKTLFQAMNLEPYSKLKKAVTDFRLITLSLFMAYIGYLHRTRENKKDLYGASDSEDHR